MLWPKMQGDMSQIKNVLDVGCGLGEFSLLYGLSRKRVMAIDISKKTLSLLSGYAKLHSLPIKTIQKNLDQDLGLTQRFDTVLCLGVLDYLVEPKDFLKKTARLVNPGGTYYLGIPLNFRKTYLPYKKLSGAKTLHWGFDLEKIKGIVAKEGFRTELLKKYLPFNLFYHMSKGAYLLSRLGFKYETAIAVLYPSFLFLASFCQLFFSTFGTEVIIKFRKQRCQ